MTRSRKPGRCPKCNHKIETLVGAPSFAVGHVCDRHRCSRCSWWNDDNIRPEGLLENPPCVHCGAPILDGEGHDEGCSYE